MKLPFFLFPVIMLLFCTCTEEFLQADTARIITNGEIPDLAKDADGRIHLTYGSGDSLLYSFSSNGGKSFSSPSLVDTFPDLFSFAMRGPQIAATPGGICIIACNKEGDIFSYQKTKSGEWQQPTRINDVDTIAKEGFLALGGNGKDNLFATWLDLRNENKNNIYGARSTDGGKTWSKNILVYRSPDGHTCECCKPSVAVYDSNVYVLFRNWLNGNRDLYLAHSKDNGNSFTAEKMGTGSWKLKGCPMDGGGLALTTNGAPQTVWRRNKKIFSSEPAKPEIEIGQGKQCTIESANGYNSYAWVENGEVVVLLPKGIKKNLGKGGLPKLKAIGNEHLLCVWENNKQIYRAILEL